MWIAEKGFRKLTVPVDLSNFTPKLHKRSNPKQILIVFRRKGFMLSHGGLPRWLGIASGKVQLHPPSSYRTLA
jgi:hypothetical protein